MERSLRLAGLAAERDEVFRLARAADVGSELTQKLVREIDLLEARFKV